MLTLDQVLGVLVFGCVVGGVYWSCAETLLAAGLHRLRPSRWLQPRVTRGRRVALVLGALGVPLILYGWLVEPYRLEVTHVRLVSRKLTGAERPVRIALLSDLHSERRPRLEEQLPDVVEAQRPDLIVFAGDAINAVAGLPVFKRCLSRLAAVAPTFVVRGNWDVWYWSGLDLYGGTGASELDGAPITMQVAGTRLVLTGVPVDGEGRIRAGLAAVPADVFTVFAYHSPDQIKSVGRADLYCAGHTHGGQVALPFYGAIVTLSRYGKRYEAGLYRHGSTWMYVNRGIGMEGGPTSPRVRFCARPELTMIELVGE